MLKLTKRKFMVIRREKVSTPESQARKDALLLRLSRRDSS